MRVEISQELLSDTLSAVSKAVAARNINPVLNHVRIVAEKDHLTFTATDGEFTIKRQTAVESAEPGRALVPARLLSDLVNRLPKKDIVLNLEGNLLNISVGRSKYDLARGGPLIFKNTFMVAADVVNETLQKSEAGELICHASRNVIVYHASDDLALRASKAANLKNKVASRRLGHTGP